MVFHPRLTRRTALRWGMSGSALGGLFGVAGTGLLGRQVGTPDPLTGTPAAGHDGGHDTAGHSSSVTVAVLERLPFGGSLRIRLGDAEHLIGPPFAPSIRVNGSRTSCDGSPSPL